MNMIKDCRAYLADNPEGYWFKRKLYGYGWIPATRQGWALTGFYFAVVIALIFLSSPRYALFDSEELALPLVGLTLLYLVIVWKKGESLKWQWGIKDSHENN